jgi:hypothetical protein
MKQGSIIDRLSLVQVIGLWIISIVLFGMIYFGFTFTNHPITNNNEPLTKDVLGFGNSMYFSFVTAMTIGYNNLVPVGFSKLFVVIEAIFSVAILGVFIAKIIAVKQEEIIHEVEELSFEESTNSAISELYIFRNDAKTVIENIKATKKSNNEIKNFEQSLSTFKLALQNIEHATTKLSSEQKQDSNLRIELILNSVNFSLSRMIELLETFDHKKTNWKKESITATIIECKQIMQKLYDEYSFLKSVEPQTKVVEKLEDLNKTLKTLSETLN